MSAPQNRQAITALREKAHVAEQYAVCAEGDWYVDAKLAGKPLSALPLGLSRVGGQRWYREGDHVLALSCALPVPPDDVLRDIAHQILEEQIAERAAAAEQARHDHEAAVLAERAERERLADIAARVEAGDDMPLEELRDLARSQGIDTDAVEQRIKQAHHEPGAST